MLDDIKQEAAGRMVKSVDSLKLEFSKIRTGRAHTSLLDHLTVAYYGSDVPLSHVATVVASDARTLTVTPWEKNMVSAVEKALLASDLGLNPATSGTVIRVPLPALTEERRRDLIKVVRAEAEGARVAIRNIRRDANGQIKDLVKEKLLSEDDQRRGEEEIQKLTDRYIKDAESLLETKEKELLEI